MLRFSLFKGPYCSKLFEELVDKKSEKHGYDEQREAYRKGLLLLHSRQKLETRAAQADLNWWKKVDEFRQSTCNLNEEVLKNYKGDNELTGTGARSIRLEDLAETFPEIKIFTRKNR